jgi:hypothetical protein
VFWLKSTWNLINYRLKWSSWWKTSGITKGFWKSTCNSRPILNPVDNLFGQAINKIKWTKQLSVLKTNFNNCRRILKTLGISIFICDSKFGYKYKLNNHLRICHNVYKLFHSQICSLSFNQNCYLTVECLHWKFEKLFELTHQKRSHNEEHRFGMQWMRRNVFNKSGIEISHE